MRQKRVWRYYCDFCRKANCSRYSISEHEKHCTNNPNRTCRMCAALEQKQPPLSALISLLPDPDAYIDNRTDAEVWEGALLSPFDKALKEALSLLRTRAGNCPACVLAALRQAKIPLPLSDFDFEAECKAIWEQANEDRNAYLQ